MVIKIHRLDSVTFLGCILKKKLITQTLWCIEWQRLQSVFIQTLKLGLTLTLMLINFVATLLIRVEHFICVVVDFGRQVESYA